MPPSTAVRESAFYSDNENARLDIETTQHKRHHLYKYRWIELGVFCLAAALNQLCWISMQPIVGAIQNGYNVATSTIAAIGIIFMGVFVIFYYPSNIALDRIGLRFGVLIGVTLTAVGMWIKVLINTSFSFVLVGQVFAAVGQPFLACAPGKLAGQWFGENERVIATTVATASQPLGVAIGYIFPEIFVT